MYKLTVKNHRGDSLTLTNNPNYIVYKIEGLNPPQAAINSSVNTTADGSVINNARLENRNIVIYITIEGAVESNRINLYKYFPVKQIVTLYFNNGSRNVCINGVVELIECDLFAEKQIAQISILCPKPYFKSVNDLVTYFSNIDSSFEFPFAIEKSGMEFSTIVRDARKSIVNVGDEETGVVITLFATGTIVKPIIYDVLRKTKIALNMTLETSDTIIINTQVGEKSIALIRNGISSNALGYMSKDSSWFTLSAGDNVFTYTCESGTNNLGLTFSSPILYSGV